MCLGSAARAGAKRVARSAEVALLQRKLGAAHQAAPSAWRRPSRRRAEPAVAALEVAQLVRGARREQRGEAGRGADLEGN